LRGFPRAPDSIVEAVIRSNVSVIDAHEPMVAAAAPANSPLFKEQCEPPPNGSIFGVSSQGRQRSDMTHLTQIAHLSPLQTLTNPRITM
jgi:hypothetical protein